MIALELSSATYFHALCEKKQFNPSVFVKRYKKKRERKRERARTKGGKEEYLTCILGFV
jgi:hypothetical protein|tara:strand:+ start:97 stop:273 length:177 start_codon:yes stop_codon:yes gene_type:complete